MPLILITASSEQESQSYVKSITSRGGEVRLLLTKDWDHTTSALVDAQGLMLTGGADVHPSSYGQKVNSMIKVQTEPERDEMELSFLSEALSRDMPVLAICRGMQLLNVAFGGSLLQDLPNHWGRDGAPVQHHVYVSPGSKLGAILGAGIFYRVNSYHHQGLREPQRAPQLLTSAYHPEDGLVEGLESPAHSWVIGVQCHPEREAEVAKVFRNLFTGLLDWAERFQTSGVGPYADL